MNNKNFIRYLNSLHNAGAQNENAIAESQRNSPYYTNIKVERPIGEFLLKQITKSPPHIIILTGHAGDGKTSLLIQLLEDLGISTTEELKAYSEVTFDGNKKLFYIKDFSEIASDKRSILLSECINNSKETYAIIIANTGPLLNSFRELLGENAESILINALDSNRGEIIEVANSQILPINIAILNNASFADSFISKILNPDNWNNCLACEKVEYCPIILNINLLKENSLKARSFITNHYIWQQEHWKRLTIRQITAQIAYAITGALNCEEISNVNVFINKFNYLFSNNYFGYNGIKNKLASNKLKAISDIKKCKYEKRKTNIDEQLIIQNDYSKLPTRLRELISKLPYQIFQTIDGQASIKRMYYFFNIETNLIETNKFEKYIFSNSFKDYIKMKETGIVNQEIKQLIIDGISIVFSGDSNNSENTIYITSRRENGAIQTSQLVQGAIQKRDIKIEIRNTQAYHFEERGNMEIKLKVMNNILTNSINLPLINYFEELTNGIIPTNIDPLLSQGIDNIKTQIFSLLVNETDIDEKIELLIRSRDNTKTIELFINRDQCILS